MPFICFYVAIWIFVSLRRVLCRILKRGHCGSTLSAWCSIDERCHFSSWISPCCWCHSTFSNSVKLFHASIVNSHTVLFFIVTFEEFYFACFLLHRLNLAVQILTFILISYILFFTVLVYHFLHNNFRGILPSILLIWSYQFSQIVIATSLCCWTLTLSDCPIVYYHVLCVFHLSWILCLIDAHLSVTARSRILHRMKRSKTCVILWNCRWHELSLVVLLFSNFKCTETRILVARRHRYWVTPILTCHNVRVAPRMILLIWLREDWWRALNNLARWYLSQKHGQSSVWVVFYH